MLSLRQRFLRKPLKHFRLTVKRMFKRRAYNYFPYMFSPNQLLYMANSLEAACKENPGGVVMEVGCAWGATTVFLNEHLKFEGIAAPDYICLDTFEGFTPEDAAYEYEARHKQAGAYKGSFALNDIRWFNTMLADHKLDKVRAIKCDAKTFNYSTYGPIAFCLLDVDLYEPIKACLPQLYNNMAEGGIIIIDDCDNSVSKWDGALQAYEEFCESQNLPIEIVHKKLGVIRKRAGKR